MTFAEKIKSERKRLGLKQPEIEAILEIGIRVISSWETGRNIPHPLMQEAALARLEKLKKPNEKTATRTAENR